MVGFLMPAKLRCFVHILLKETPSLRQTGGIMLLGWPWNASVCPRRDLGTAASEREEGRLEISA